MTIFCSSSRVSENYSSWQLWLSTQLANYVAHSISKKVLLQLSVANKFSQSTIRWHFHLNGIWFEDANTRLDFIFKLSKVIIGKWSQILCSQCPSLNHFTARRRLFYFWLSIAYSTSRRASRALSGKFPLVILDMTTTYNHAIVSLLLPDWFLLNYFLVQVRYFRMSFNITVLIWRWDLMVAYKVHMHHCD